MKRWICLYSPMIVLFAWAGVRLAGAETSAVTIAGRVLLGVTLTLHTYQEWCDRKA
jgi:hypothetical protein